MKKFIVMTAVATMVVFQGFAQEVKVNPWLRGDNNKSTEEIRAYWLDGIVPQGTQSTLGEIRESAKIAKILEAAFARAGITEDWEIVVARAKCVEPNDYLRNKKDFLFWGSLNGWPVLMPNRRELAHDEQVFWDPETDLVLGGCKCANATETPIPFNSPVVNVDKVPPTSEGGEFDLRQDRQTHQRREEQGRYEGGQQDQYQSQQQSQSSNADDCVWCNDEDRNGYVRIKDVETFFETKHRIDQKTNDEYLRVKQGESNIRNTDKAFDALVDKSRCCDDGEYSHYDGGSSSREVVYVQSGSSGGGGSTNVNINAGGMGGMGLPMPMPMSVPMNYSRGYRPYGNRAVPVNQGVTGWGLNHGLDGGQRWNPYGAAGLSGQGFIPNNGR